MKASDNRVLIVRKTGGFDSYSYPRKMDSLASYKV